MQKTQEKYEYRKNVYFEFKWWVLASLETVMNINEIYGLILSKVKNITLLIMCFNKNQTTIRKYTIKWWIIVYGNKITLHL